MKNLIMLGVLTMVSHGVFAGEVANFKGDPKIRVIQSGEILKVIYLNSEPADVRVSLLNEEGAMVFSEKIRKQQGFIRPYNLSNLDEGIYQIAIEYGDRKFEGRIAYMHGNAAGKEAEFLPHVCKVIKPDRKERYLLSVPCSGQDKLAVTIFDAREKVLYADTYAVNGDFAQVFRIENGKPGDITIQVANKNGKVKRFVASGDGLVNHQKQDH
jgi:hypothetical protein